MHNSLSDRNHLKHTHIHTNTHTYKLKLTHTCIQTQYIQKQKLILFPYTIQCRLNSDNISMEPERYNFKQVKNQFFHSFQILSKFEFYAMSLGWMKHALSNIIPRVHKLIPEQIYALTEKHVMGLDVNNRLIFSTLSWEKCHFKHFKTRRIFSLESAISVI